MSPATCLVSPVPSAGRWVPYPSVPGHLPSPGGPGSTLGPGHGHRPARTCSTRTSRGLLPELTPPEAHTLTQGFCCFLFEKTCWSREVSATENTTLPAENEDLKTQQPGVTTSPAERVRHAEVVTRPWHG